MKTFIQRGLLLAILCSPCSATADRFGRVYVPHPPRVLKGPAGDIRGLCSMLKSDNNPISGPCVNLVLVLLDEKGTEVLKSRTNPRGQIEFAAEKGKVYRIIPGSRFYEIKAPLDLIHGGDTVKIFLKLK